MGLLLILTGVLTTLAVWAWPRRSTDGGGPRGSVASERVGGREPDSSSRAARPATVMDVADAMDLLALALESGAAVPVCLDQVAGESDEPVAGHLRQVAAALRWGVEPRAAWADVPDAWSAAGSALTLADAAGTPPAGHLREASRRLRESEQHRVELAGATVAVRLVVPLGLCFLPAFVLLTVVPVVVALASELLR